MSPLLETIKLKDGKSYNLEYHNRRMNNARREYFGLNKPIDLSEVISVPEEFKSGLFRCRLIYSPSIEKIEFLPHQMRIVKSLKLVEDNSINYRFKFANRQHLQKLFEQRGHCDDILIVQNGYITDSFTANPIFFDGQKWWTPDTVLLPGTQRARYLKEGIIYECRITPNNLKKYKKVGLINALCDMNDMPIIKIENIK